MELLGNLLVTVFIVRWRICLTPFGLVLFPWSFQTCSARAGWFLGLGANNKKTNLPDTVKVGDPVLHEPAQDVDPIEIKLERVQKIIDDMIQVMRKASGVGLAAPQIGIPLRIIVLEDTKEYISYVSKEEAKTQDRRPADLLVILNPKLDKKGKRIALFFEGCLRSYPLRSITIRPTWNMHSLGRSNSLTLSYDFTIPLKCISAFV
ncbi:Peptide deformylase 1A, chloroplastic [Glycine soja]|uniref:Peptide deformylase n=1 Tax=Glycine soja TaxID=3848 RepID=A0A445ILZ1_GLYSO|nr:Peptide deformylase 1A, chloroplastic [Glycine soja]